MGAMSRTEIRDSDREEVAEFVERHWRSKIVMSGGKLFYPHKEEGFIERVDGKIVGLLTFRMDNGGMEILTLKDSLAAVFQLILEDGFRQSVEAVSIPES